MEALLATIVVLFWIGIVGFAVLCAYGLICGLKGIVDYVSREN